MTKLTQAERITRLEVEVVRMREDVKENNTVAKDLLDELTAFRKEISDEMKTLSDRQTKTETRLDKILGNARAFGAGFAAAFTVIGTAIGAGVSHFLELFK